MRRRVLLHPTVIAASRNFVNVRMNPWLDETNHERELKLVGGGFGGAGNTQNTIFCLFEPDAPGLSADSFPTEESVHFGTRPGRRYPICCTPESVTEKSIEGLAEMIRKARLKDTGGVPAPPGVVERIAWEYQNAREAGSVASIMDELAKKHPARAGSERDVPVLPVMPDVMQALNIAAADSRAVVAVVQPDELEDEGRQLERRLSSLLFESGIAGRLHLVRVTLSDWQTALKAQLEGGSAETGVFFVAPHPFGLRGEVVARIEGTQDADKLRHELREHLDRFQGEWRKLDRATHLARGSYEGIVWSEYDPVQGRVVRLPVPERPDTGHSPEQDGGG